MASDSGRSNGRVPLNDSVDSCPREPAPGQALPRDRAGGPPFGDRAGRAAAGSVTDRNTLLLAPTPT